MKRIFLLLCLALVALAGPRAEAQFSVGNYRIPYANSLTTAVLLDHVSHPLTNRVTLQCIDATANPTNFIVVAAEDGMVRYIQDGAGPAANYVWIEHTNREWTGYFFLSQNSITGRAGLTVGTNVTAGQIIGVEGQVGSPGGASQLRFEVGVPTDPDDPIVLSTGMLKGVSRAPVICNIPGNVLSTNQTYEPLACFAQQFSYGTYRMPYSNSVQFRVSRDHLSHAPSKTRYDLVGNGGPSAPYPIAAAAAGIVKMIVDNNTTNCLSCSAFNNYVWIAHSNGEWTKYTHFTPNSVRQKANLKEGDFVTAGTYLGDEGKIGAAVSVHLHFEVGFPYDQSTNSISGAGGFLDPAKGVNRIPLFCNVPGQILFQGDTFTAGPCASGCNDNLVLPARIIRGTEAFIADNTVDSGGNNVSLDSYGSLALHAGSKVTLRPGFKALTKSYLRAAIQPCFNAP